MSELALEMYEMIIVLLDVLMDMQRELELRGAEISPAERTLAQKAAALLAKSAPKDRFPLERQIAELRHSLLIVSDPMEDAILDFLHHLQAARAVPRHANQDKDCGCEYVFLHLQAIERERDALREAIGSDK